MQSDRSKELYQDLVELYSKGVDFDYGSLVYEYPGASAGQDQAIRILEEHYSDEMNVFGLGLNHSYASFLDCLIGKGGCYKEQSGADQFSVQKCLFVLFCHYKNIYVLGEHQYFEEGGFVLPSYAAIDKFTLNCTKVLANEVTIFLKDATYQRVYAADLGGVIPIGIQTESNLVGEKPLVFDGYFNETD